MKISDKFATEIYIEDNSLLNENIADIQYLCLAAKCVFWSIEEFM